MFVEQDPILYNRYTNLDGTEWRVISHLLNSKTKHADNLWKLLSYPTEDCLFKPSLSLEEKGSLIYTDNGLSEDKRVFFMPYVDDAWTEQASRLDIFVDRITPTNHIIGNVNICFEVLVHNKISNILADAEYGNAASNPSEITKEGKLLIPYKSRATSLLKCLLAELNGTFINGVGTLQFNVTKSPYSVAQMRVWNNRAYFGYSIILSTDMSGVSENCDDYLGRGY